MVLLSLSGSRYRLVEPDVGNSFHNFRHVRFYLTSYRFVIGAYPAFKLFIDV